MAIVKTIDVAIRATTEKFDAGLKKARGMLSQFTNSVGSIARTAIPGIDGMADSLGALAGKAGPLAAVGAAIAGIGVAIRHAMSEIDRVADVSLELGIDPRELLSLEHAANATGVEIDRMQMSLQRLTVEAADAVAGSKRAQATFRALGLDASVLAKASPDAALRAVADAFQAIDKPSERARLAVELFGRQGISMLRVLNLGSAGLEEMRQRSLSLGNTINSSGVSAIDNWKSAWADLKSTFNSVSQDVFRLAEGPLNLLSAAMSKAATAAAFLSKTFLAADAHAASVVAGWEKVAGAGEVAAAKLGTSTSKAQRMIDEWKKGQKAISLNPEQTTPFADTFAKTMASLKTDAEGIRKSLERVLTPQEQFLATADKIHKLHGMDLLTLEERNAALLKAKGELDKFNLDRMNKFAQQMRMSAVARSEAVMTKLREDFESRMQAIANSAVKGPAALERGSQEAFAAFQENKQAVTVAKDQLALQKKMEAHLAALKRSGIVLREAKL